MRPGCAAPPRDGRIRGRMTESMSFDPAAMVALDAPSGVTFLTGRAGTGKSTIVRHWLAHGAPANTLTLAPTGVAALQVGGMTVHRFIHAGPGVTPAAAARAGARFAGDPLYRALGAIVVDEAGMVRADLMDCLDRFLKAARRSRAPFGGLRTVMVGDLAQLPPVVARGEAAAFGPDGPWPGPWFFQSHVVSRLLDDGALTGAVLTEVHRQADPAFVAALNDLRDGNPSARTLAALNRRVGAPWDPSTHTVLCSTNRRADEINVLMLSRLHTPLTRWRAETAGQWERALQPAPATLDVRAGMRVMMLSNDPGGMWANGSTGTLLDLDPSGPTATVRIDAGASGGAVVEVGRHVWQVTAPRLVRDPDDPEDRGHLETVTLGSYTQLPFAPGWAATIHKSQGRTLNRVRIELGARPLFAAGQAYVAFSRATGLAGISLDRPLTARDVRADPAAAALAARLARPSAPTPPPAAQEALF